MAKVRPVSSSDVTNTRSRPPISEEAHEKQMIALAVDLVEQRLRAGTASAQETVHYLKLSSSKNKLELEKLEAENKLLRAKTEALESQKRTEELYEEAIKAMRVYAGYGDEDEY